MKNFLVRIPDELHNLFEDIAKDQEKTNNRVVRDSLTMYINICSLAKEGKKIFAIDPKTGEKTELIVAGVTFRQRK
jgi:hypothetical protein